MTSELIEIKNEISKQALEEIIVSFNKLVNNMTFDYDSASNIMAQKFLCTHRTLQQSTIKLIACFIKKISTFNTDLRNEAAIKWANDVAKIDSYFPFI